MRIDVRFLNLDISGTLYAYTVRRIRQHLGRLGHELSAVTVRIGDVNGPKGGIDKRCQVIVRGPRVGVTTLDELGGDPYTAVDLAVERTARAVGRGLERARSLEHKGPSLRLRRAS